MIDDLEYKMLLSEARLVAGQIVRHPDRLTDSACLVLCFGTEVAKEIARERKEYQQYQQRVQMKS